MEFGRITDSDRLHRIRWDLPPLDSPEEIAQLQRLERAAQLLDRTQIDRARTARTSTRPPHPPRIRLGTPVWSEPKWQGKLFPPGTKSENFLKEYAKQFTTVEVNSTFYSVPAPSTFEKWRDSVPDDFRFCPKFPQTLSRSIGHDILWAELDLFLERIRIFGDKLGVSFLQLPQETGIESLRSLRTLLDRLPTEARTHLEFRNASFFHDRRLKPEVIEVLAKAHVGTVITDTAMYRPFTHASLSNLRVLIRFASNNGHPTDQIRIPQWTERLATWLKHGLRDVYLTVHGTDNLAEIEIARDFIRSLNKTLSALHSPTIELPEPEFYHERQGSLF